MLIISMLFFTDFIIITVSLTYATEAQYECGTHGKFEYCIDGIPGCVIGCHCHPGYYFDTDTKICEPNVKLTQDYRRHHFSEPTRIQLLPAYTTPPVPDEPADSLTTTLKTAIDSKIDEITKDADDLGDWLYNQFFKTIENQVINNTQASDSERTLTRRSGGDSLPKVSGRRSHKYWKGKKKKKRRKKKKKGLKSKLLRITEDDSLFDESSRSSGSTETEESSASTESESDSEYSKEKDEDHGHKKIVVFNKRPRPPLPSFIFLPNMETPFYPPIGLPPPPVMPMYPMVPVPPMMSPMFPYPGATPCAEEKTTATEATSNGSHAPETTSSGSHTIESEKTTEIHAEKHTEKPEEKPGDVPEEIPEEIPDGGPNDTPGENPEEIPAEGETDPAKAALRTRVRPRNKMMKKLREKLKRKNKIQNFFANTYQDPLVHLDIPPDIKNKPNENAMVGDSPRLQDVDFKYLSQLIHRANLNQTLKNPTHPINPSKIPKPTRRNFNTNIPNPSNQNNHPLQNVIYAALQNYTNQKRIEDSNDAYYSNLGRQIATMIRKIDSKGEREVNIEFEKTNSHPADNPIFNQNNYGSRSYWERSVRSPLLQLHYANQNMDVLRKSNEDLFSLENQVAIVASTPPALDLKDLENIIRKLQKTKSKLTKKGQKPKHVTSKTSFNVNLLPRNGLLLHSFVNKASQNALRKLYEPNYINQYKSTELENSKHDLHDRSFEYKNRASINIQDKEYNKNISNIYDNSSYPARNFIGSVVTLKPQSQSSTKRDDTVINTFRRMSPVINDDKNQSAISLSFFPKIIPTRKPIKNIFSNNQHILSHMKFPFLKSTTDKLTLKYQFNPVLVNRNYFNNNNNHYLYENAVVPVQLPALTKNFVNLDKPSYFHHEFHHFDYFEDFDE